MAGGWRATARMMAVALAAAAVTRTVDSVRRLSSEAAAPEVDGPRSRPEPLRLRDEAVLHTADVTLATSAPVDLDIAAHGRKHHEFGPTPVVAPSRGIGFRPVAEMPVIVRPPGGGDPEEPRPDAVVEVTEPQPPVVVSGDDLDEDPDIDDDELRGEEEDALDDEPEPVTLAEETSDDEGRPGPDDVADDMADEAAAARAAAKAARKAAKKAARKEARKAERKAARLAEAGDESEPETKSEPEAESEPEADTEPDTEAVKEPAPATTRPKRARPRKLVAPEPVEHELVVAGESRTHRRDASAVTGTVRTSRGAVLRGIEVTVVDADDQPVASAVTGSGGIYVIEGLPAGRYRLTATDHDGGFEGRAKAPVIKVKADRTRRKADITMVSSAVVDVAVDGSATKVKVGIKVTERGTGVPATGSVTVTTSHFRAQLPLDRGRSKLTLLPTEGQETAVSQKVDVDYGGDKHTGAASASSDPD